MVAKGSARNVMDKLLATKSLFQLSTDGYAQKDNVRMTEQKTVGTVARSVDSGEGIRSRTCCFYTCCVFINRYHEEPMFRQHVIRTGCLYLALFTLGFAKGQIGPSFIDLQTVSGVGLEEGSALLTTIYVGYMGGACVGGFMYIKIKRVFTLTGANILLAVVTLVIPWCSLYWLMLAAFSLFGLSLGVTDSVASGDLQYTWGNNGRPYMQGMQLMYAIGIALAPLIAAPFLSYSARSDFKRNESDINICVYNSNGTTSSTTLPCFNNEMYNISTNFSISTEHQTAEKSQLYLSYMFTTVFSVLVCAAFIVFYFRFERENRNVNHELSVSKKYDIRKLPKSLKCLALGMLVSISGLICCIDDTFLGFLTTFCVKHLNWTKSQGAVLTSASSSMVVVGRMVAVFVIQFISPVTLVGIHSFVTLLSFVGFYFSAIHLSNIGVCFAALGFGFGKSAILPSVFSWIEEVVAPVTGKIAGVVFFVITALTSVNPVIMANMMENLTDIWFVLLLLGESTLLFLAYIATVVLSKYIVSDYGYTYNKTNEFTEPSLTDQQEVTDDTI
ncbi:sodium-dependent glucose transporter 1A-like [Pecten maximus]|uniref:sodium-dependent glucose transporter 1A-like n=1 Tax=Pecten maximus TaxID=6579 RepID=UPI0014585439|nr:sodium-dependent glucose transporter 1A-like [Pecten maximus]